MYNFGVFKLLKEGSATLSSDQKMKRRSLFIKNASHQTEWGENVFAEAALHWGIHDLKKLERNPEKRTEVFDWKIHLQGSKSHRRTPEEGHESKTETSIFKETSNASLYQCRLL